MNLKSPCLAFYGAFVLAGSLPLQAQWQTQSFELRPGWNAIYLHVHPDHTDLEALIGSDLNHPVQEVWLWQPAPSTREFTVSPQVPKLMSTQWANWSRTGGPTRFSPLLKLVGNAAYLVRVTNSVTSYTWTLKGKVVPPRYEWTSTGLNFLGFPTPSVNSPSFETFLSPAPSLAQSAEIYRYIGGDLGANNPQRILAYRTNLVRRGEAFWIRSGATFNRYFGPFELSLQNPSGVDFGDVLTQYRVRVRNLTPDVLTVTLELKPSESPPDGQPAIVASPPLLLRGNLNTINLTHSFTNLAAGPRTWTLAREGAPGSSAEMILGVDRSNMTGPVGALYGGILRFTDSLSLSQVDLPVSAKVASQSGLWVGEAAITHVRSSLTNYVKDLNGALITLTNGQPVVSSVNTNLGAVAQPFPLRLILHHNATAKKTVLLQRVYYGSGLESNSHNVGVYTNPVVATTEGPLDKSEIHNAFRISAAHLPFSITNKLWSFTNEVEQLMPGTNLTVQVVLPYDHQASNPFLHTYHPDHDNLDASYSRQSLPQGFESYGITRNITLTLTPPRNDFASLTRSSKTLEGVYSETMIISGRGEEYRQLEVQGVFSLTRVTDIPVLSQ